MVEKIEQNYNQEAQVNDLDPELELLSMVSTSLQKNLANRLDTTTEDITTASEEDEEESEYESEVNEYERLEFKEDHLKINQYPLGEEIFERFPFLNELPQGIAVMGGVARSIARQTLTGDLEPIRDIDLVNITDRQGEEPVSDDELIKLSEKYMPEDFAFGHGIQSEDFDHYFQTRDFTINQSLVLNGNLYVSEAAQNDFIENIIRPTYYELPYSDDELSSRLFLKAVMMKSILSNVTSSVPLIEDVEYVGDVRLFDIALTLNKTMSRGVEVARGFTRDLVDWDLLRRRFYDRPVAAAKYLRSHLWEFDFYPSGFKEEESSEDKIYSKPLKPASFHEQHSIPDSMYDFHSSDPAIRRAIAEYEIPSGQDVRSHDYRESYEEPEYGHYSESDYEYINS